MNYLVMTESYWNKLEYRYFQLIDSLDLIILTRETDFIVWKNKFANEDKDFIYPISTLKDYLKDAETLWEWDEVEW